MQSTLPGGALRTLDKAYISIKGVRIPFRALPDLGDSKGATYSDEPVIGRATTPKVYSYSSTRKINIELYFYICEDGDAQKNIGFLRLIQSATYPEDGLGGGAPYVPPPVCKIKFGSMLGDSELCAVLMNTSVKFPRDVAYDEATYCPYFFQVSTEWDVVYKPTDLPGQDRIAKTGR
jgi:hypothetical protein